MKVALKCVYVYIEENQPLGNFHLLYTSFSVYIVPLVVIFLRGHRIGCICKTVTKVIDPILFLHFFQTTVKSGKSRIKNLFSNLPKGTHPLLFALNLCRCVQFDPFANKLNFLSGW